jgi:hypothetical protein
MMRNSLIENDSINNIKLTRLSNCRQSLSIDDKKKLIFILKEKEYNYDEIMAYLITKNWTAKQTDSIFKQNFNEFSFY